jgi:uncharacterized protein (DUF305 family)
VNALSRILLVGALCLSGCAAGCSTGATSPAPPAVTASAPGVSSPFGGTDLAWIEINIAMDEQLLPLLDLVQARSKDPDVRAAGSQIAAFTATELATLRALHDQAALPAENPHKGMPMPGMVTPEQVTAAAALTGAPFEKIVVQRFTEHLEQSRQLATSEEKAGVEPQTRALALDVLRTRKQALSTLEKLP